MLDVTDATFETLVLARSEEVPVVVDLWAPWCGPCRVLGPILEAVVEETQGAVELAKVNVDENPGIATTFKAQSIPAVHALRDRAVVDSFVGALPERDVRAFVAKLAPTASEADLLVEAGDEASLRRALELEPDHEGAIAALATLAIARGDPKEALELTGRVAETPEVRRIAAQARLALRGIDADDQRGGTGGSAGSAGSVEAVLDRLLDDVKHDDQARQDFIDLLETLGPDDPRTARYRKALAARIY